MAEYAREFSDDGWLLQQTSYDPECESVNATLFALANGDLGVRGGIDEITGHANAMLADAFEKRPITYHESFVGFAKHSDTRFAAPSPATLELSIDGNRHLFDPKDIISFYRNINLQTGISRRVISWKISPTRNLEIAVERCVPIDGGKICISNIRVKLHGESGTIAIKFPLENVGNIGADGDGCDPRLNIGNGVAKASESANGLTASFEPQPGCDAPDIMLAQSIRLLSQTGGESLADSNMVEFKLDDGETAAIERIVAYAVGSDGVEAAVARLQHTLDLGTAKILEAHQTALATFWQHAAIEIDGNAEVAHAIKLNLFHLFQSASRTPAHSMAAKGLTGEGYEGHYFWDSEAFVLPVLAFTEPAIARNIISYRIGTLGLAKENARGLGHMRGALYPWRTIAGEECSTHYPTGAAQYHINAAIAFATEEYAAVTGDDNIFREAAEMIFETARIWMDIGHFSDRRGGAFVIHGVTGPDEYSALVDNDHYTNFMAKRHLAFAQHLAAKLGAEQGDFYAQLRGKIGLEASEIENWQLASERMWLPIDDELMVHPQDDSFLDKPVLPIADLSRDQFPLLLHYHPLLLFRHRVCKQGDVIQALAVAGHDVPRFQKERDFDFYEPLTTHDSTLSATAFGIVAAEIGREERALEYLTETAFVDLKNLHANSHHGVHMAAMAGSWLILARGWGGMRTIDGQLHFRPTCPAAWNGYSFRVTWRGSLIEVKVNQAQTRYQLLQGPAVQFWDHGRTIDLTSEGATIPRPPIEAVIFDLDGVLTDTAQAHYLGWKRLSDEEGMPFDHVLNEQLKGVDREGSLAIILKAAGRECSKAEREAMMVRKNGYYREAIAGFSPKDLFPGAGELLADCLTAGLRIGLASASRNARDVVNSLGIAHYFDIITDAATIANGKPDPEIFLKTAEALGIAPNRCVGVEDARAGIAAINGAGMCSFGIGDAKILDEAERVFASIEDLNIRHLTTLERMDND